MGRPDGGTPRTGSRPHRSERQRPGRHLLLLQGRQRSHDDHGELRLDPGRQRLPGARRRLEPRCAGPAPLLPPVPRTRGHRHRGPGPRRPARPLPGHTRERDGTPGLRPRPHPPAPLVRVPRRRAARPAPGRSGRRDRRRLGRRPCRPGRGGALRRDRGPGPPPPLRLRPDRRPQRPVPCRRVLHRPPSGRPGGLLHHERPVHRRCRRHRPSGPRERPGRGRPGAARADPRRRRREGEGRRRTGPRPDAVRRTAGRPGGRGTGPLLGLGGAAVPAVLRLRVDPRGLRRPTGPRELDAVRLRAARLRADGRPGHRPAAGGRGAAAAPPGRLHPPPPGRSRGTPALLPRRGPDLGGLDRSGPHPGGLPGDDRRRRRGRDQGRGRPVRRVRELAPARGVVGVDGGVRPCRRPRTAGPGPGRRHPARPADQPPEPGRPGRPRGAGGRTGPAGRPRTA